jgi:hypothetical protein
MNNVLCRFLTSLLIGNLAFRRGRTRLALALMTVGSISGTGWAALMPVEPNGPTVLLTPTTAAADPTLEGTVIADTTGNFTGQEFSGTYQTRVVRRDDTSTLDFYYRITSFEDQSTGPTRMLRDFRVSDYVGFTTDVTWRPDGEPAPASGEIWLQAIRFPQPTSISDGINLSFADLVNNVPSEFVSGDESFYVVIRTEAMAYTQDEADVYVVTGNGVPFEQFLSEPFPVYVPAVPEPALGVLAGIGSIIGLLLAARPRS